MQSIRVEPRDEYQVPPFFQVYPVLHHQQQYAGWKVPCRDQMALSYVSHLWFLADDRILKLYVFSAYSAFVLCNFSYMKLHEVANVGQQACLEILLPPQLMTDQLGQVVWKRFQVNVALPHMFWESNEKNSKSMFYHVLARPICIYASVLLDRTTPRVQTVLHGLLYHLMSQRSFTHAWTLKRFAQGVSEMEARKEARYPEIRALIRKCPELLDIQQLLVRYKLGLKSMSCGW